MTDGCMGSELLSVMGRVFCPQLGTAAGPYVDVDMIRRTAGSKTVERRLVYMCIPTLASLASAAHQVYITGETDITIVKQVLELSFIISTDNAASVIFKGQKQILRCVCLKKPRHPIGPYSK